MRRRPFPGEPRKQLRPSVSKGAALGSSLIGPALLIALAGLCAVIYLCACARLSVIECDQRRLERIAEDEQARELNLQRRLAELGNAEEVRTHVVAQGLCRPVDVVHVSLTDVPPTVCALLPGAGREEQGRELRLGQLPPNTGGDRYPASAFAP
jgi:hypothetical protein